MRTPPDSAPGEARRRDVGEKDDLLVGDVVRDLRQVGLRRRDEQVLGLRAVDRVAEAPAADGLVAGPVAALREVPGEAGVALAARGDRADEHALADLVAGDPGAELLDHADRLMAEDQARTDRVLALDDVDVRAADRRERHPDQGLARTRPRPLHLHDVELLRRLEDVGSHGVDRNHLGLLCLESPTALRARPAAGRAQRAPGLRFPWRSIDPRCLRLTEAKVTSDGAPLPNEGPIGSRDPAGWH